MERYRNLSGESGIVAYELGTEVICVQFRDGAAYRYSSARAGKTAVDTMHQLALAGRGLNSFINREVRKLYD